MSYTTYPINDYVSLICPMEKRNRRYITTGPLHGLVTWHGINYAGTQITQWEFQNKGTLTSSARRFFVLKVPLRYLRFSLI